MKRVFLSATAMLAACGVSASAQAATPYLDLDLGGGTATFGHTGVATGSFADTFTFYYPTNAAVDVLATIFSSAFSLTSKNIEFTDVKINGVSFDIGTTGQFENWSYAGPINTGLTANTLSFAGNVIGGPASYAGTVEFTSAAVPEPAAWALMIGGVGLIGLSARKAKQKQRELATA